MDLENNGRASRGDERWAVRTWTLGHCEMAAAGLLSTNDAMGGEGCGDGNIA